MNYGILIENEIIDAPKPYVSLKKIEYSEQAKKSMMLRAQLKEFEERLIHKLPNEFRDAFKGYNFRSENDFHIDKNNYIYF